jgi:hypothetical protein
MSAAQMMAHLQWGGCQVTKPEPLILQRQPTIPAPLQPPKADKAPAFVGIRQTFQRKPPHSLTAGVQLG